MTTTLPRWAAELRDLFRSGSCAQFLLHGNIFDLVPQGARMLSVKNFLDEVMFQGYDVVLHYDRSRGIRAVHGAEDWDQWLRQALGDDARNSSYLREPGSALELIDRFLLRTLNLQAIQDASAAGRKLAVIIDFAEFVVPRGEAVALGGAFSANVVKVLGWANDPAVLHANIVTVLLTENLHDLNELVFENPHAVALRIPLPDEADMREYLEALVAGQLPELPARSDVPLEALGRRLTGLSRVSAHRTLTLAEIAHHAALSVPHFGAMFRRQLNCSPLEMHIRLRMQRKLSRNEISLSRQSSPENWCMNPPAWIA